MCAFFNTKTGEQRKAEGQAKAAQAAGEAWREEALFRLKMWLRWRAARGFKEMNFDQFRESGLASEPPTPNAWGTLPRAAVKRGLIEPTDRVAKAKRPQAQSRIVKVWAMKLPDLFLHVATAH
jgi:hypothetical protein